MEDRKLAEKMLREHYEQYHTLVRMHLSFELDLNTDDNEIVCAEKHKTKKLFNFPKLIKTSVVSRFPECTSQALTETGIIQIRQIINYLVEENNITQEGIFRRTGSVNRQNELKSLIYNGKMVNLNIGRYSVHDCASVLKSILAELPEPLLTDMYFPAHCQIAEFCNAMKSSKEAITTDTVSNTAKINSSESRLLRSIQLLFLLLPNENYLLLLDIIEMLHKTIKYAVKNKMSANSLSTLFTPHLICPRKLTPATLHTMCQNMSAVVSFMITTGPILFNIPSKLATDIRAYFVDQKRKETMSPEDKLNESITSETTANTVYTFIDREKTAQAHDSNPTDTALAQLYAHIQSLPETSKKRKLIKQFNKENGQGTPLQIQILNKLKGSSSNGKGTKSLGDSIKKRIFHKNPVLKQVKRQRLTTPVKQYSNELNKNIHTESRSLTKIPTTSSYNSIIYPSLPFTKSSNHIPNNSTDSLTTYYSNSSKKMNYSILRNNDVSKISSSLTSSPCSKIINKIDHSFLPDKDGYYDKCKSEPNLTILSNYSSLSSENNHYVSSRNEIKLRRSISANNLQYLLSKNNKMYIKSSCYELYSSFTKSESALLDRKSISPITKSTQRMSKAMKESIMTPRSRKPLIFGMLTEKPIFGSSSLHEYSVLHADKSLTHETTGTYRSISDSNFLELDDSTECLLNSPSLQRKSISYECLSDISSNRSLSTPFREYLLRRNVHTISLVDSSFSSHPDDFGSNAEIQDLSETDVSKSMLYCLNGNNPFDLSNNLETTN